MMFIIFFEDSKHRIWIATYGGGLNYMVRRKMESINSLTIGTI